MLNLRRIFTWLVAALILKVVGVSILNYRDYFPPNFEVDFLRGRQPYFSGSYHWAFYVHIVSGPLSLAAGLILISDRFRRRFPKWHRLLGRLQVLNVLLLVAPSGLWMARHADGGPLAVWGFFGLAITTGACVALGWIAAMRRRFAEHRLWMQRSFLLLCSAVGARIIGGLVNVTDFHAPWIAPLTAWVSWLPALAVFELSRAIERWHRLRFAETKPTAISLARPLGSLDARPSSHASDHSPNALTLSLPAMEIKARRSAADISAER